MQKPAVKRIHKNKIICQHKLAYFISIIKSNSVEFCRIKTHVCECPYVCNSVSPPILLTYKYFVQVQADNNLT